MARRYKILGRDIVVGKRLFGYGREDEDYYSILQQRFGSDFSVRDKIDAYNKLVAACITLIGEQVGSYQPILMKPNGDQMERIANHELLDLLRNPNGNDPKATSLSQFDILEATASFLELMGNCYWYIARGQFSSKPKEIIILRPDKVGISVDKDTGEVDGYFIRRNQGENIPLEVDEILHFRYFNPKNPYTGVGKVELADDYIATDEATSKFTRNFFQNNAGLSGILSINGEVSKGAFKKFVRAWRSKYEGVDAAGKTAIVRESDASFTKIGLGLDELDMNNLRNMTVKDVLRMFRVPLALLGEADQNGLGRANVEALEYIFAKYNIEPKLKRVDAVLQFALKRYWNETGIVVGHENIIPDDKEHELAARIAGVDKWNTRNEIRDEDGLDPVDGGDQLFVPMANIPVGDDTGAQASTTASTSGKKLKIKLHLRKKEITAKEHFRLSLMRNQGLYERRYLKAFRSVMHNLELETLVNLEAKGASLAKDFTEHLFDPNDANKALGDELLPVLVTLTEQQGGLALLFAGDEESEFAMTADISNFVKQATARMANNFNADTLAALNSSLTEGVVAGESIQQLKGRVKNVFDGASNSRATRVARTETLRASNKATEWAYKQTGYVTGKEWYVNPDACAICAEFEGKVVGLSETFINIGDSVDYTDDEGNDQSYSISYDDVEEPPLHPNCRCTILPYRERA